MLALQKKSNYINAISRKDKSLSLKKKRILNFIVVESNELKALEQCALKKF